MWRWYIFHQGDLLLERSDKADTHTARYDVPCADTPPLDPAGATVHTITLPQGEQIKTFALEAAPSVTDNGWLAAHPAMRLFGLRATYELLPLAQYRAAGRAFQILHWDKLSRFCPACGTPTVQQLPNMKRCPKCGQELYPPIATAIIVLIRRDDEILLVHARNFRGTFYGLVAGFLEVGETLEECVRREVMEETGLTIQNLRYFGSQSWPYPSGLMVGFTADYESGQIKLQDEELSAGAFYSKENLPEIPGKASIARKLIDWWLKQS